MNSQEQLINYDILAKACQFYKGYGFKQIEVPWIVSDIFSKMQAPLGSFTLNDGRCLISSAEQGFFSIHNQLTPLVKYFSVSPCFRDDIVDEIHSKWFMKLELYQISQTSDSANDALKGFIDLADELHWSMGAYTERVSTYSGCDLILNGIKVGSFCTGELFGSFITYGTGLALPRFSIARNWKNII